MSSDEERLSKAVRTGPSSDTLRLMDIPVLRHRLVEDEKVELMQFVMARDVRKGAVLSLVWKDSDVMAYVRLGAQHLDTRRFEALLSNGRASKIVNARESVL